MSTLFYVEECFTTQEEADLFCSEHDNSGKAVYTFNQTKGKGQYGNIWKSHADLNLAYSVLLASERVKYSNFIFNYYTAVTVRDFIANLTQEEVKIKWPNDLIINRKKICGMITEMRKIKGKNYFITGIGINVLQEKFENLPKAGSLLTQTGKRFDLHQTASELHEYFTLRAETFVNEDLILKEYNAHLFGKDSVSLFNLNGNRQNGIIRQALSNGRLEIELENDGLKTFYHKEIEMLY